MRCEDAAWKMLLYVDGELSAEEAADVEAHLAECPECRAELERIRGTQAAVDDALSVRDLDRGSIRRIRVGFEHGREVRRSTRPARLARAAGLMSLLAVLLALGTVALQAYLDPLASQPIAMELRCPPRASDDAPLSVPLLVRDAGTGVPLAEQPVLVSLTLEGATGPSASDSGRTDAQGVFHAALRTPAVARPTPAVVTVRAGRGFAGGQVECPLQVQPARALFVWADRPVAPPGGSVTLGGLVLHRSSGRPAAGEKLTLELADPQGRQAALVEGLTDEWGVALGRVRLPSGGLPGLYRLTARCGQDLAAAELSVAPEAQTDLVVGLSLQRPADGEGGRVRVSVATQAGAPVPGCPVELRELDAGGLPRNVRSLSTGADGACQVSLPSRAADGGPAVRLLAEAVTAGLERGVGYLEAPVGAEGLSVLATPRGGVLVPGRPCILDVLVLDGGGHPVAAHVAGSVSGNDYQLETGPDGVAELWLEAAAEGQAVAGTLRATSARGGSGSCRLQLVAAPSGTLAAAPDRGICRAGETLSVDLASDRDGLAAVGLLREGAPVWSGTAEVSGGEGHATVALGPGLTGSLSVVAYWVDTIAQESATAVAPVVYVLPLEGARVEWNTAEAEGADAPVSGRIRTRGGDSTPGALVPLDQRPPGVPMRLTRHPALAFARLGEESVRALGEPGLRSLVRSIVAQDRPARNRRPARVVLEAARQEITLPAAQRAGPHDLQAGLRRSQYTVFRAVAVAAAALFAGTLAVLLWAGEMNQRGLWRLGEGERALRALRSLRTDLLVAGVCLALAAATAARMHVLLAQAPEVTRLSSLALPGSPPAGAERDLRALLASGARQEGYLPLPPSLVPSSAARGLEGEDLSVTLPVALPLAEGDTSLDVLAVTWDGGLAYSGLPLRRRSFIDCAVSVDPVANPGTTVYGCVRLVNHTAFAQHARVEVSLPRGCEWVEGPHGELPLAARTVAEERFRFRVSRLGRFAITARATTDEGLSWSGRDWLTVEPGPGGRAVAAGAVVAGQPVALARSPSWPGAVSEVRFVAGREALVEQLLDRCAGPWLTTRDAAAAIWLYTTLQPHLRGVDAESMADRAVARDGMRAAWQALRAGQGPGDGFGRHASGPEETGASAWALLALSRLAEQEPEAIGPRDALRERLEARVGSSPPERPVDRALAAWALAESGAPWETVERLLPASSRVPEPNDAGFATWALAGLSAVAAGRGSESTAYGASLWPVYVAWVGQGATGGGDLPAAALVALAAQVCPTAEGQTPPDRRLLIGEIARLRGADGLFGSATADALCGAALLETMSSRRQPATVECGWEAVEGLRGVVAPQRWLSLAPGPAPQPTAGLTLSTLRAEPVQYVVVAEDPRTSGAGWSLSVRPLAGGATGTALLRIVGAGEGPALAEARIALPPGLEPYLPDLASGATATGALPRMEWAGGVLRVVTDRELGFGFRVRAARGASVSAARQAGGLCSDGAL